MKEGTYYVADGNWSAISPDLNDLIKRAQTRQRQSEESVQTDIVIWKMVRDEKDNYYRQRVSAVISDTKILFLVIERAK